MGIFDTNYDLNKYRFFYAVATYRSFSKAAEMLYVSQPAISYAIKDLEAQLGTKLFIRDKSGVILTEKAEQLLVYVKKAFDNILMGNDVIQEETEDLSGTVRIGIYSHISLFILPDMVKEFSKKHKKAKFFIYSTSNEEMIDKLKNKELDFLVVQYPLLLDEYKFTEEFLFETETCLFSSKKYYDMYVNDKGSLEKFPIIFPLRGYPDINKLEQTLNAKNLKIERNVTGYTTELNKELAKKSVGVSWGIKKCIEKELKDHELYELPVDFELPKARFSVIYNEKLINDTTKEFIKYMKKNINKYTDIN